jgi:hypothetical protein
VTPRADEKPAPPPALSPDESAAAAARSLRHLIAAPEFPSENHRRAAMRRVLHASAAGLDAGEATRLVEAVRSRFPDRTLSASSRARDLKAQAAHLEAELARHSSDNARLRARLEELDHLVARLLDAAGITGAQAKDAALAARRVDALTLLVSFASDQDSAVKSVEDAVGRAKAREPAGPPMRELLARIARGEGKPADDLHELERRLRRIRLLPAALLAGAHQSWKAGTLAVLEHLDPNAGADKVPTKVPGLREAALLKECRSRFEAFWNQLDKNIAHYYRGVFEKIYSEKMEDRT